MFTPFSDICSHPKFKFKAQENSWVMLSPLSGLTGGLSPVAGEIFPRYRSLPGFCRWWCAILLDAWTRPWLSWVLRGEKDWKRGESQCWFHVDFMVIRSCTLTVGRIIPDPGILGWEQYHDFGVWISTLTFSKGAFEPLKLDWVELGRQAHIVPPVLLFCTKICRCQGCLEKSSAPPWSKALEVLHGDQRHLPLPDEAFWWTPVCAGLQYFFCWFEQCSKPPLMSVD